MQDQSTVVKLAEALYDKKARDIVALNVSGMTVICDYMLIATGRSTTQVGALAEAVEEAAKGLGLALRRTEGQTEARWVVMDYGTILVHIFHPEERSFYNLERLWEDGENRLTLPFDQPVL